MGLGILGNVWVCPCLPLLEPGTGLQPFCAGAKERQPLSLYTNACGWVRGIHNCDGGELNDLESRAGWREERMLWGAGEDWTIWA